jgi:hypothetical protein
MARKTAAIRRDWQAHLGHPRLGASLRMQFIPGRGASPRKQKPRKQKSTE